MKTPVFGPGGQLRSANLDLGTAHEPSRPAARQPPGRIDPPPFTPMPVKRLVTSRSAKSLVIDMEEAAAPVAESLSVSSTDEALICASRSRLRARIQQMRETVSDLRLEIEALRRP